MSDCFVCDRIEMIKNHRNKYLVKEMKSGYVVFCDFQYFYGYTIFMSKTHTDELYKLAKEEQKLFLEEMVIVAEAVAKAFHPVKMNYELLGNSDSHIHWHLIPRYGNDLCPKTAIWEIEKKIRCGETTRPSDVQLIEMKSKLLEELNKISQPC